jgi:hypothetical protein
MVKPRAFLFWLPMRGGNVSYLWTLEPNPPEGNYSFLVDFSERRLGRTADRAHPRIGQILEGRPRCYTPFRITLSRIVDVPAHSTNISSHSYSSVLTVLRASMVIYRQRPEREYQKVPIDFSPTFRKLYLSQQRHQREAGQRGRANHTRRETDQQIGVDEAFDSTPMDLFHCLRIAGRLSGSTLLRPTVAVRDRRRARLSEATLTTGWGAEFQARRRKALRKGGSRTQWRRIREWRRAAGN